MIYHLLPGNMEHHVPFIIKYFRGNSKQLGIEDQEQSFTVFGTDPDNISKYNSLDLSEKQLVFYPSKSIDFNFLKGITAQDSLIIHSVFFRHIWLNLLIWPKLWKRTAIINWGAGFENFTSIRGHFNNMLRKVILPKLGAISTLTPGEFESIKKLYGNCNNYVRAFYFKIQGNITLKACKSEDDTQQILLGNSAWDSNNHIEVLNWLKKFKTENINIICPLAYPSHSSYKDKVLDAGRQLLGDKFQPITQMMSPDQYDRLLDTIDTFILNAENQQALYIVYYCILQGKKVYIPKISPTYKMLADCDIVVYDTLDIPNLPFNDFLTITPDVREHNIEQAHKYFSIEATYSGWKELFSRIGVSLNL